MAHTGAHRCAAMIAPLEERLIEGWAGQGRFPARHRARDQARPGGARRIQAARAH